MVMMKMITIKIFQRDRDQNLTNHDDDHHEHCWCYDRHDDDDEKYPSWLSL